MLVREGRYNFKAKEDIYLEANMSRMKTLVIFPKKKQAKLREKKKYNFLGGLAKRNIQSKNKRKEND